MQHITEYFFCSPKLLQNVEELQEVYSSIDAVTWQDEFSIVADGLQYEHQSAYNKAFSHQFSQRGWISQPKLCENPRLIGDFQKNDIFVEIQFGNSATIYRDYYKFHYGLTHGLLSLAVLIVPTNSKAFFPTRHSSVSNMAEFDLASRCFKLLPIPVPIVLIGLLPKNQE
ncbi:MAG: hypothetical protein CVV35_12065 [Methanomicrobiales archaeon HGW-Methanomicrobiales-6]|jgi:hypothetical protein|nr:MAG: hypothetical protein CVV35_12065 [Methanomicrobiales archaeon HGW-Methanomicrobiales-6]